MAPIVDGLETEYSEQIVVRRINANQGDGPAVMQNYRIPGHPTTLIFNANGQEVQRFIGPQSVETVKEALQAVLDDSQ